MKKRVQLFIAAMQLAFLANAQELNKKSSNFHDISISGFYIHLNDGFQYGMGTASVYYKKFYAETRYNYEDLKTFSAFAGYSFGNDKKPFKWELIPMIGLSAGNTSAFIPALETNFEYKKFVLFSENEYAINLNNNELNYFYSWSEFTYKVNNWLQPGIVAQRTQLYKTGRDMDRGFMANAAFLPKSTISAYVFDPFDKKRVFFVFGLSFNF